MKCCLFFIISNPYYYYYYYCVIENCDNIIIIALLLLIATIIIFISYFAENISKFKSCMFENTEQIIPSPTSKICLYLSIFIKSKNIKTILYIYYKYKLS